MFVSEQQADDVREIAQRFPAVLKKAISDWAKFKAGRSSGLFTPDQVEDIIEWFSRFPELWSGIRPQFVAMSSSIEYDRLVTSERPTELARVADNFSRKLGGDILIQNALGIAPLIIAGIMIASAFGLIGVAWGIGYIKKQNNISRLIEQVTAGKISEEVLKEAITHEEKSLFGEISDIGKYAAIAAGIIIIAPFLIKMIGGR